MWGHIKIVFLSKMNFQVKFELKTNVVATKAPQMGPTIGQIYATKRGDVFVAMVHIR